MKAQLISNKLPCCGGCGQMQGYPRGLWGEGMTIFCLLGKCLGSFFFFFFPTQTWDKGARRSTARIPPALSSSRDTMREREKKRWVMGGCHDRTLAHARWRGAGENAALQQPHINSENGGHRCHSSSQSTILNWKYPSLEWRHNAETHGEKMSQRNDKRIQSQNHLFPHYSCVLLSFLWLEKTYISIEEKQKLNPVLVSVLLLVSTKTVFKSKSVGKKMERKYLYVSNLNV